MARKKSSKGGGAEQLTLEPKERSAVSVPAAEAFSFLREMRGVPTWSIGDLRKSLKISAADAKQVLSMLELQGYVQQTKGDEYITTLSGDAVSGSKPPRYTLQRVEAALASLAERIAENNKSESDYKVTGAVAFGDFLYGRARVQAADVGIQLARRAVDGGALSEAQEQEAREAFLKKLRAGDVAVHLRGFEEWMAARNHRKVM